MQTDAGIDGVDIWPSLMSGTSAPTGRAYLPTTERSLLWDDGEGHMYKLITSEFLANRFTKNGSQSVFGLFLLLLLLLLFCCFASLQRIATDMGDT